MAPDFATVNAELVSAAQSARVSARIVDAAEDVRRFMDAQGATRMSALPHPMVIDQDDFDGLVFAATTLIDAQTMLLRSLLEQESVEQLLARFHLPALLAGLIDVEQLCTSERLIARFDVLPTAEGYQFCEMNVDPSVSGFEFFDCARRFCRASGLDWLGRAVSPASQIAAVVARAFRAGGHERVVVCDWSSRIGIGYFGFEMLRDAVAEALPGVDVHLVYHREYPADWLRPSEAGRTLVYRGFMLEDVDDLEFVRRLFDSGAEVISRFDTEIRTHKLWFAMLHEAAEAGRLPPVAADAVRAYLPRTVRVAPHNIDELVPGRADWVFKYGFSCGGQDVIMGTDCSEGALRQRLAQRGMAGWVAQQRLNTTGVVSAPRMGRPPQRLEVVLGLYLAGDEAHGMNVRADASTSVVNVHNSASSGWAIPLSRAGRSRAVADLVRPRVATLNHATGREAR